LHKFFFRPCLGKKLLAINFAVKLADLAAVPGNRQEALRHDRRGQHSIRINDKYRICFNWRDGNA